MSQDQLMPWESGDAPGLSESEAADSMFDALGPEFDDEGQPEERDEQPDPEDDQGDLPDDEFEGEEPEDEEFEDEEESEEDDEEEGEDESADDAESYEVKIDGETVKVPLDELKAGYSRTQDYTRKTQELAKERSEQLQHLEGVRSQYVERLEMAEQFLQSSLPQRPSDQLRKENPGEYAAQMEEWRDHVGQIQTVQSERQRAVQEQQQQWAAQEQVRLAEEQQRLVTAVPEWKDDSARQKGLTELQTYLQNEYGYSEQELAGVDDHRALLIAKKAAAYDKMMSEGGKKLKKAPVQDKPLEPGSRKRKAPSKTARKKAERAHNRLKQTGSVDDAAAALLASGAFDD